MIPFLTSSIYIIQSDGSQGIQGQQYLLSGAAVSAGFTVNSYMPFDQVAPSVFSLGTNGYFVLWQSDQQDGSGWGKLDSIAREDIDTTDGCYRFPLGTFGQLYSLLGPAGSEVSVANSSIYGNQTNPVGVLSRTSLNSLILFEDDSSGIMSLLGNIYDTSVNSCTVLYELLSNNIHHILLSFKTEC